jgi:cytochrome b pre-mRNA-processing protein 3
MFNFYHRKYNIFYNKLVQLSRNTFFYVKLGLSDKPETRVILVFIHFAIILIINKNIVKTKKELQKIFDNIFANIEFTLRENGHGDVAVNKKMKILNKVFYDILLKLGKKNNNDLTLNRSLLIKYLTELTSKEHKIEEIINYLNAFFNYCLELSLNDIIKGEIKFKY